MPELKVFNDMATSLKALNFLLMACVYKHHVHVFASLRTLTFSLNILCI